MKWGKKKQSSSRPFFMSQVLPTSWLTKFKQMNMNSDAKLKQKGKWNSVTTNPSSYATTGGGGKFYGGDDDAFWRLSFGEDSLDDGMKSRGVLKSVLYNSDVDLEFPPSSCYSYRSNEAHKFSDARKMRELPKEIEILPQAQVREIRTPRLRIEREKKLRKESFEEKQILELEETQKNPRKAVIVKNKPGKFVQRAGDSYLRKIEEDAEKESDGEWQKLKERKIEKVKSRSEEQRKSLYITRDLHGKRTKQNSKVRVNSPRTAEICKVKALQDMKKAKLKKKAIREEFQSFAVVKCSYDPQKDFRDSMIEMIKEHNISRPQQLEQLLACYLTLNSDQYHDLIIRVFRQVYQASFHTE